MDIAPSSRLKVDWLTDGLFGPYADAFNRHLTQRRYAASTIASYTAASVALGSNANSRSTCLRATGVSWA